MRGLDRAGELWGDPVMVGSGGASGGDNALLEVNREPAIAFYDTADGALRYVRPADGILVDGFESGDTSAWTEPLLG